MSVIVTGAAGFIGMHVSERLLSRGEKVLGVDSLNSYYDPRLKQRRLERLKRLDGFAFEELDIAEAARLEEVVRQARPRAVVHLAAQAGVRYSLDAPFAYERSNLAGHLSVLEAVRRQAGVAHLVYASSSSVYGDRQLVNGSFHESDPVDRPVSLYAATKRACELMSETYSHLYGLSQSGLRFFTAYGPWGRPDMAYFSFCERILRGEPIEIFGEGRMARDFTYIDDIVEALLRILDSPPPRGVNRILNVGGGRPAGLMEMVAALERALGVEAHKIYRPMQPGDVTATCADVSALRAITGYEPRTSVEDGIGRFVRWRLNEDWLGPTRQDADARGRRIEAATKA